MLEIEITRQAAKSLLDIPKAQRKKIEDKIEGLAKNPLPPGSRRLKGKKEPYHRIRVGDYRVIYQVENDRLKLLVIAVAHRREVYR